MKKTKMFMLVLTSAVLALTPVTANAAEAASSQVTETVIATPSPTPKKPQKKGWVKTKSGIRRYYRKGKRLTGFQKIGKNYFYFSAKGTLLKNTTVNKGYRGFTYYIDNKSYVIGRKKGSTYYTASGKRMTQVQIANLRSKQSAGYRDSGAGKKDRCGDHQFQHVQIPEASDMLQLGDQGLL